MWCAACACVCVCVAECSKVCIVRSDAVWLAVTFPARAPQELSGSNLSPRASPPGQSTKVWACSRRNRNRRHQAIHGNLKVVVANISSVSNLRLAVASGPDVAVLQELWATKEAIEAEAKEHGYVVAVVAGSPGRAVASRCRCWSRASTASRQPQQR